GGAAAHGLRLGDRAPLRADHERVRGPAVPPVPGRASLRVAARTQGTSVRAVGSAATALRLAPSLARHAVLALFAAGVLVPLLWIAFSSVKSVPEQYRVPSTLLPYEPTLQGYAFVLKN